MPSVRPPRLRAALAVAAAAAVAATAAAAASAVPGADDRPNIVFLFSDDHAAHALSAYRPYLSYGARLPDTPNLDRLAREGMLFVNAFVTNSICGPARATVLTGEYGHLSGVMTNREALHPMTVTFPKLLRAAGYETSLFGKWHLKTTPEGFDHFEILAGQGPYYNPTLHTETDSARYAGYTSPILTDRALRWLKARDRKKPFLLMLNLNAPHRYWDPGPAQLARFRDSTFAEPATFRDDGSGRASPARLSENTIAHDLFARDLKLVTPPELTPEERVPWERAYAAENEAFRAAGLRGEALARWKYQRFVADYSRAVAGMDAEMGRILDFLRENGLDRNTLVVYSSDQGFFVGDDGWFDKRWMYEESLRTPLLVRWPGVVKPGSVNRDLVMNLDLPETFLEAAGVPAPAAMQGRSLVPLLRGRAPADWRDAIYYQYFEYPDWHMVRRQYGVRTDRYKLIHYYEIGEWELFDLRRDPNELASVYADPQYAGVVRELKAKLVELRRRYRVPDRDPEPYFPIDIPTELRRPASRPLPPGAADTARARTFAYDCDGFRFTARIARDSAWLLLPEGAVGLAHTVSADGARYAADGYLFWSRGDEAMIESPEHAHSGCRSEPARAAWEDARLWGADFRAAGIAPAWSLELRGGDRMLFVGDDGRARIVAPAPPAEVSGPDFHTVYRATGSGHAVTVTLDGAACTDPATGERLPTGVVVAVDGRELRGCGRALR